MRHHKKNKKGSVYAVGIFIAVLIITSFTIIISKYIIDSFYTEWNSAIDETPEMISAQESLESGFMVWDYGILMLMIVLMIGLVWTSLLIPTHPVFMVINLIGIFLLVFLGMVMNNVYGEFVAGEDATFTETADSFPIMNFLIGYMPYIVAVIMFIVTILIYTRSQGGGAY